MFYEVSREAFKQRLENKLNFVVIDLTQNKEAFFKDTDALSYGPQFLSDFKNKYTDKSRNYLLYSLKTNQDVKMAAESLAKDGYQFVYFYVGSEKDLVLDKGLN
jgi:hypothetical protein